MSGDPSTLSVMSEISQQRSRVQRLKRRYEKWQAIRRRGKGDRQTTRAQKLANTRTTARAYREYAKARTKLARLREQRKETTLYRYNGGGLVTYQVKRKLDAVGGVSTNGPRSGLRTTEEQAQLYNAYINGTGAPAFPPWGPSLHLIKNLPRNRLHAADVTPGAKVDAQSPGAYRPYGNEPWHTEWSN